jgi:predicted dehydrogenase
MQAYPGGHCGKHYEAFLYEKEIQTGVKATQEISAEIRVGVIGVGHLGRHHARIYSELPNARLVGVSDLDEVRGREVAGDYGTEFIPHTDELLTKVDAVSIAVPANGHFRLSRDALTRGVHTLVEKPITCTLEEAELLIGLGEESGARLFVGHTERFSSPMIALRKRIKEPLFMECHRLTSFGPRGTDVAVVLDLMIHDIDMVLWLVAQKLVKVDAIGVPVLTEHEDIANARLEFASGCVANLTASRVSKEPLRKMRIFQKNEYMSIDYPANTFEVCTRVPDRDGQLGIRREQFEAGGDEPLRLELRAFLAEIGGERKTSLATAWEGRKALAVALQVLELTRGRRARLESGGQSPLETI